MALSALAEALDGLFAEGAAALADCASIVEVHRQLARLDALTTLATGQFDAARNFEPSGAQTAAQWITATCHIPKGAARHRVALGRKLRHLSECERAWTAGDITGAHVSVIAGKRRDATAAALARDESLLVDKAKTMRFDLFVKTVDYWDQVADPDGAEDRDRDRSNRRDAYLVESIGGMWLGKMTLDPVGGTIVAGEMGRLEREMFQADWADAKARLGREPTIADLRRTPAQRRADALIEMAARSKIAPADGRRPAPLFSVYVGYETLYGPICELAAGTVLAPGSLLPWLDQARIERVVFGLPTRIEVSASARLFTGGTRKAIRHRDHECSHEFCDRPSDDCQVDHIVPYARGGPTTQHNGEPLCAFHNRLKETRRPPPGRAAS